MNVVKTFSSDINSTTSKDTDYMDPLKQDEQKIILDLKKKADKAFKKNEFEKAYNLYNQALQFNQNDYDLNSCLTGAALNLGRIDEVFSKTDILIDLDSSKAQGYYLKGVAYDLIFKFDLAIDFFLKALDSEEENINIIVKNLIKTVVKFIKKDDSAQIEDPVDTNDTIENLLKLTELCGTLLRKSSNNELAIRILKFVQKAEPENYNIKTELLLVLGKFFKNQRNFDKAILTYEECCHLASLNDDLKLKIKSIVSISSCYLEMSDLHKVIYYYHKLIDIEGQLDSKETDSSSTLSSEEMINLELRVAIRQNLFIAHYKLGKLRICCFYLSEIIDLIDRNFNFTDNQIQPNAFDFIQIKIDASIELCKLYHIFEDYIPMKILLDKILKFIEDTIDKLDLKLFNEKQLNSLRFFKIKCYSHLGICLAGLRDFRFSKLSTRKCLCLIDKELEKVKQNDCEDTTESFILNSLKLECLIDATEASNQILKTYSQMKNFIFDPAHGLKDKYAEIEIKNLLEIKSNRDNLAKSAYLISKSMIDPNIKIQATFNLAVSLYDNHLYQSAAHYFNEVISISSTHVDKNKNTLDNLFYSDLAPDYKLESSVFLCKCQLMIDYYGVEFIDIEILYKNLMKDLEELIKHILKWRLHETNRTSFQFNSNNLECLKQDRDSVRLKNLVKICSECLIYICYKLKKYEECLVYMELENFINNSNLNDLIDLKLIDLQNEFNFESLSYENFFNYLKLNQNVLLRYKFIFEAKILYVIVVQAEEDEFKSIIFHSKIKTSQILNKLNDSQELSVYESKLDYLKQKLDSIQNDRIKNRVHEFEYRSFSAQNSELNLLRIKNRLKEKSYFDYLIKSNDSNYLFKYNFESIDLYSVKLSEKMNETLDKIDLNEPEEAKNTNDLTQFKNLLKKILENLILDPIREILKKFKTCLSVLIDSEYAKLFVLTLNSEMINYVMIFDSYLKYSSILSNSMEKDLVDEQNLSRERQEIIETPNRFKKINSENFEKIHKSQIVPRYTSHPRQAVNLLNQNKNSEYVKIKNDYVQRVKNRLDASVSVLISETVSGTNAKRSDLEVIEYKQANKKIKCCVIGCPELENNKFLKNGLNQLSEISQILYTEPIFSHKMTKQELMYQLETNNLIFLSTFSTNESDSVLICSQSIEFPSSLYEFDKYCKFTSQDLDLIDMYKCDLLILNCYSSLNHKPRFDLVKKIMSRGCKSVLLVLNPLEDELMLEFYKIFLENLKNFLSSDKAYMESVKKILELNSDIDPIYLNNSFVLISTKSLSISLKEIAKSMVQLKVDRIWAKNLPEDFSILSANFVSSLEKNLIYLQILIKFLLNDLIVSSKESFRTNEQFEKIFSSLNDQISRSINLIKSNKINPEILNEFLDENLNSQNLLKCLGFSIQRQSVYTIRDEKDKKVLLYPDHRFLDLNVRLTHVMSSLIDLCFRIDTNEQRVKQVVYNLESLLPIDDKNLLKCLIDLIAVTKFSPDVMLNTTDYSIYYALNYFEYLNDKSKCKKIFDLMNRDYFEWDLNFENQSYRKIEILPSDLCTKYSISNRVVNFLLSLGFEIIGTWIRFNESLINRIFLDLTLKFLSSFTIDRDMSLYKELNINVLGQRSAVTRGLVKTASNLNKSDLEKKKDDSFKLKYGVPWCSKIETMGEMEKKVEFSIKYESLKEKISRQRQDALNHYMNYVIKQSISNKNLTAKEKENKLNNQPINRQQQIEKVKYKKGGSPSKNRVIANERCRLTYDQVEEIRQYSYLLTRKNVEKIDLEFKEKTQKLLLPLIKK